jgi:site-specific DNA-methyltransferase (adenine-specific)
MPESSLIHGEALATLRTLPDASVDAVITDPPYGANIKAGWDRAPSVAWVAELPRLLRPGATVLSFAAFPFIFALHEAMEAAGFRYLFNLVWRKRNGGIRTNACLPRYQHEHILAYTVRCPGPLGTVFNGYDAGLPARPWTKANASGVGHTTHVYAKAPDPALKVGRPDGRRWIASVLDGAEKPCMRTSERTAHPTQKPLEVVCRLATLITPPGGVILDPFAGSGTTGVAALQGGYGFIGIEQEAAYIEIARARLAAAAAPR